jgi:hypothetical protein
MRLDSAPQAIYDLAGVVSLVVFVRSHSHDSSFMHSDVSLFYSYTVVAETHFVIVTAPLVSLFMT